MNADAVINGSVAGELNPGFRHTPTQALGLRVNHVWTIGPTVLNHASFGFTRVIPTWATFLLDPRLGNQTLQIPGIPADSHGFTNLHLSPYADLGNADSNGYDPELFKNGCGTTT